MITVIVLCEVYLCMCMFSVFACLLEEFSLSIWNPNGDFGLSKLPHILVTSQGLDRLRSMASLNGLTGKFVEAQEEWCQYDEWNDGH